MKKMMSVMGILLLVGVFALPMATLAQDTTAGKNTGRLSGTQRGRGMMGNAQNRTSSLTTEQQEQIEKLQKKFREDNAETIKELMTKRFDLNTILSSDNPDADKAKAVQKDISELNAKLAQERIDLHIELMKIAPDTKLGQGLGRGMGMMGMIGAETGI